MNYETIGIVGGMGPYAGIYFAHKLISLNSIARKDADHVAFILHSDPNIPDLVDSFLIRSTSPIPMIVAALQKLKSQGADFGVIACNTAHIYFDEIAKKVGLPLINMIENTAKCVATQTLECPKIGLLATTATIKSGLYSGHFNSYGIEIIVPTDKEQTLVSSAIFGSEFGIKATGTTPSAIAQQNLAEVTDRLRARTGVQHLILGCTELSFALPTHLRETFHIIDPIELLAQYCLMRTVLQTNSL